MNHILNDNSDNNDRNYQTARAKKGKKKRMECRIPVFITKKATFPDIRNYLYIKAYLRNSYEVCFSQ